MPFGKNFDMSRYLLAGYGVFGIMGPALFGFGVGVAHERQAGWMLLKMASPMPIWVHFSARTMMAMLFAGIVVTILFVLGHFVAQVDMTMFQWLRWAGILILGAIPFCVLGLVIGYLTGAQAAIAVANLTYLPMAILSGLWWPLTLFPDWMQHIAWILPPFHLAQFALAAVDMPHNENLWIHGLALVGFTVLFAWIARMGYRRDAARRGV